MYGAFKITYHPQKYISTPLAKCLSVLFLKTPCELITLRSLYSEYSLSSIFDRIMSDDDQIILNTNVDIRPLVLWYTDCENDNGLLNDKKSIEENISCKIKLYNATKDNLIEDINSLNQMEKVLLILGGKDAENILDSVHKLSSLHSIFIYCLKKTKYDYLKIKYPKVINIINHPSELADAIKKQQRQIEMQQVTLSLYDDKNLKTIRFLPTGTSTSFVWYQLLKNMICLEQEHNSRMDAKREMIKLCKRYSNNNEKQINDFESKYSQTRSIQWYTKDTFLYRFVNRVLRTENIADLFALRFYIADLSTDLKNCQQEQKKNKQIPSTVYRGQKATMEDIKQFQANRGRLISSNGYLSTTKNINMATIYTGLDENQLSIIFRIKITKTASRGNIFACISKYSQFPEEEELLFDIGAVFKLQSIKPYKNQTWLARLVLSSKEQEQADTYIKYKMKEFQHLSIQLRIGQILIEVGISPQRGLEESVLAQ
ncbi:unnamed protein product [Adineta steineri]|uniref:ADP ribosyltransferase domain-containing protein n=1 Tax=Adineta steineri TaxID=433720 RepID=A0A819FHH4_9BILA|nr:unnamed protein product [Adineta steineri]CAF3868260.1 unnamed protein product [Adineta steineri]